MRHQLDFWGKAAPGALPGVPSWHPLVYHSLDVAAVAEALLHANPLIVARLAVATGLCRETVCAWVVWLAALHDLGKFALGFQGLSRERWAASGRVESPPPYRARHDALARLLVEDDDGAFLESLGPIARGRRSPLALMAPWLLASTSHHGKPALTPQERLQFHFPPEVLRAAAGFALDALTLVDRDALDRITPAVVESLKRTSWLVAGLVTTADWIGSNREWFEYTPPDFSATAYWTSNARPAAARAVAMSGMKPAAVQPEGSFAELFPGFEPTKLQAHAATAPLGDGACLVFIEEATGGGKTEAALLLAARMIGEGRATGFFVGLPTMATANALYLRVNAFCDRWFAGHTRPQVVLAHGQRALALELLGRPDDATDAAYAPGEQTASRDAHTWVTDSTRRSLLAQIAVGTIDQALLGALAVKHQAIRVFGLARSVLVVDEVHACDEYMLTTLKTLLEVHAAQGGSAVLLSATLPMATRRALASAFRRGVGATSSVDLRASDYPLVTTVTATRTAETPVACRPSCVRRVLYRRLEAREAAEELLIHAARAGECGVWIRNTVGDAVAAAARLQAAVGADRVTLLHSRFCLGDRLAHEQRASAMFGSGSSSAERSGHLVVATQVAEQSLDLDFDRMVTDAAPIDRLIQRAGRLQRHVRDLRGDRAAVEGRPPAVLNVVAPAPAPDALKEWHRDALGNGRFVYTDVAQVWRTLRWLEDSGGFEFPRDARAMMESVFGAAAPPIPAGLEESAQGAWAEFLAQRSIAIDRTIDVKRGYVPDLGRWGSDDEGEPGTRLGEPTVVVRLARRVGDSVEPYFPGGDWTAWSLSEVRLRRDQVASEADDAPTIRSRARATMADGGEHSILILLSPEADGWTGVALNGAGRRVQVRYSATLGLSLAR